MTEWVKKNINLTAIVSVSTIIGTLIGLGIYLANLGIAPGENALKIRSNTQRIQKIEEDIEQLKSLNGKVERIDERTIFIKNEIEKIGDKLDN